MQLLKPENYFTVREALMIAGRADRTGGCGELIPAQSPKEAVEVRHKQAVAAARYDHYHSIGSPTVGERTVPPRVRDTGYRPDHEHWACGHESGRGSL